ncbi:MAG: hypothetical protein SGILL_004669 [Bacillariaceae sp.]
MIRRLKRNNSKREAPAGDVVTQLEKPRRPRAGVFTRFRKSSIRKGTKKRKNVVVLFPAKTEDQPASSTTASATASSTSTSYDKILRESSVASADATISADGTSMDSAADSSLSTSPSCQQQDGDAPFFPTVETLHETKEVLIPTTDGQIETQRQECRLSGMHKLNEQKKEQEHEDHVAGLCDDSALQQPQQPHDTILDVPTVSSVALEEEEEEPFDVQLDTSRVVRTALCDSVKPAAFQLELDTVEVEISDPIVELIEENDEEDCLSESTDAHSDAASAASPASADTNEGTLRNEEADQEDQTLTEDSISVPSDEDECNDEEEEEDEEEEADCFSDFDEEEEAESLRPSEKGAAFLQDLFLSDLPDDDETYIPEELYLEAERNSRTPFTFAMDALEDFAAESIYSASLLFMEPVEVEEKRLLRRRRCRNAVAETEQTKADEE